MGVFELKQADQKLRIECVSQGLFLLQAETAWFRVSYQMELQRPELETWTLGVEQLRNEGAGAYLFDSLSNCLRVEFAMGKRGDFHVSIHLQNEPDYLNEVRLVFRLDQSLLQDAIDRLHRLAE